MANYDNTNSKRQILQPSSSRQNQGQDSNGKTLATKICLTYTPPLISYLESGEHKATCWAIGFCSVCALQDHVKQALSSSGGLISPTHLVKNLKSISKSFRPWRQEDAHEYMRYLIESLDNCCSPHGTSSNPSPSQDANIIQKIFGGRLRSQVKCMDCSTCSNTYDPFLDLSLEIVRADSLTKALNRFTAVETLEEDNEYYCANCQKKVHALKQFTIDKSPMILTIQFKRFSGTGTSGGKIDKKIDFGLTLAMKPYISNPQDCNTNYSLYICTSACFGWSTYSGHYYCFVRTAGGLWHNLDDSRVRQVSEKSVLDQKAYILFYMQDVASQSSSRGEQYDTNSSPTLSNNGYSEGTLHIENNVDKENEEFERDACQCSQQHSSSCTSCGHLCSKVFCQETNCSTFRYPTRKVDRSTHVWKL